MRQLLTPSVLHVAVGRTGLAAGDALQQPDAAVLEVPAKLPGAQDVDEGAANNSLPLSPGSAADVCILC